MELFLLIVAGVVIFTPFLFSGLSAPPVTSITTVTGNVDGSVGSVIGLTPSRLDVDVSTRLSSVVDTIQRGTISLLQGSTSATATISAVVTARAWVEYNLWRRNESSTPEERRFITTVLTNTTTVTAERSIAHGTSTGTIPYQVIELL